MRYREPNLEKHKQFLQNRKEQKAIYLAINTNIRSFNNICLSEDVYFPSEFILENALKDYDSKFGIYLGKIIFEKKGKKLIPKYIPTSLENLEEELEKINPLWLAEKNPNYIKPEPIKQIISIPEFKIYNIEHTRGDYRINQNNLEFQCKIEKNTKVLTKDQIRSYVKEIHSKNVKMIQNHIDTIHKDYGIKPYVFSDEIYDELNKVGILTKEQAERFKEGGYSIKGIPSLLLTALDYLAKQNRKDEDYLITFDDEYFYAYLVWSLHDFLLDLSCGMFQDETKLLFNPIAYMDDTKIHYKDLEQEVNKRYEKELLNVGFEKEVLGVELGFEKEYIYFDDYYDFNFNYTGIFEFNIKSYFAYDEIGLKAYEYEFKGVKRIGVIGLSSDSAFNSPNFILSEQFYSNKTFKLPPSALGRYYFELEYQKEIYIELLPPYYPSLNNLEGWDKKMLEKANLKIVNEFSNKVYDN
ncbi:hypothetical protein [Campylobacter helveticus]|uniref:hypothetical protein n=1 Tax=Campylobacter helveticus TaxID=28898 RepID=UPI001111EFF6|nr:hypothetical protein [Campylobacter helveticus]TNB61129.1 hypothetical protein FDW43_09185 [Campylobacter helveticus]